MQVVIVLLLMFGTRMGSLVCPDGKQPCGSSGCFDPTIQGCTINNGRVQCQSPCNGTCLPSWQYCYNDTKICNKNELVCDRKISHNPISYPLGLTCYNSAYFGCYNGAICDKYHQCGSQCLTDSNSSCAKDQTICYGFPRWDSLIRKYLDVCGPRQQCFDNRTSICLNGTTVCDGLNAQLCSTDCLNPDTQICTNGVIECINSCNGTCYSNSQYCYNDTKVCNNDELVCDVKISPPFSNLPLGLNCYDLSRYTCLNDTLCRKEDVCGSKCSTGYYFTVCKKNLTLCDYDMTKFYENMEALNYYIEQLDVCGPQLQCYNTTISVCVGGTTVCEGYTAQLCNTTCFNPNTQVCINGTVQCRNSCNGTCYSNYQYCYSDTKICSDYELVCDIKNDNGFSLVAPLIPPYPIEPIPWPLFGITCYNPSIYSCHNNTLCIKDYECGEKCIVDRNSVCVNNETICFGFDSWYSDEVRYADVCGPEKQCYDKRKSVCLNENIACEGLNARLCGTNCFNPNLQICTDGLIECIKSCNDTCYSSSQYCYNRTKICNNNESICDVKNGTAFSSIPLELTCYDPSRYSCYNRILCSKRYVCGSQCLRDYNSACANNQTVCYGFPYSVYSDGKRHLALCGPQKICYDTSTSICLGSGTLCPIGSQLCSGVCYNPQLEYCVGENSTIYNLNTSSVPTCLATRKPGG